MKPANAAQQREFFQFVKALSDILDENTQVEIAELAGDYKAESNPLLKPFLFEGSD